MLWVTEARWGLVTQPRSVLGCYSGIEPLYKQTLKRLVEIENTF